jgi:hypothetical protein
MDCRLSGRWTQRRPRRGGPSSFSCIARSRQEPPSSGALGKDQRMRSGKISGKRFAGGHANDGITSSPNGAWCAERPQLVFCGMCVTLSARCLRRHGGRPAKGARSSPIPPCARLCRPSSLSPRRDEETLRWPIKLHPYASRCDVSHRKRPPKDRRAWFRQSWSVASLFGNSLRSFRSFFTDGLGVAAAPARSLNFSPLNAITPFDLDARDRKRDSDRWPLFDGGPILRSG